MDIYHSRKFAKEYRKLPLSIKLKAEKRELMFRKNPNHPSLKTHKLEGEIKGFHSFSIDYHYRIVFHFEERKENGIINSIAVFDTVGTHEIYR